MQSCPIRISWLINLSTERIRAILNGHSANHADTRELVLDRAFQYFETFVRDAVWTASNEDT